MIPFPAALTAALAAVFVQVVRNLRDYALPKKSRPAGSPLVSVCIPARNEAENIGPCLAGWSAQTYPHFEVLVLDDGSTDGTAAIVEEVAAQDSRVRLVEGAPLPPGWAGKVHACAQLAAIARGDYLLFVDADTRAAPELLGSALAVAEETEADMVTTFPRQVTGSFWEAAILPMLQFLVVTLLPLWLARKSRSGVLCAACGQFQLFRRAAYLRAGGHAAIPASFHDGLQLARRVKRSGGRVVLFDGSRLIACRMYRGGTEVWNGFTRNAYEAVGSLPALVFFTGALALLFLAPYALLVLALLSASPWLPWAAAQVLLVQAIKAVQCVRFGHWSSVALLPVAVAATIAIQWASFLRHLRRCQTVWRDRQYSPVPAEPSAAAPSP